MESKAPLLLPMTFWRSAGVARLGLSWKRKRNERRILKCIFELKGWILQNSMLN
jgi:hypothetical protein